MGLIDSFLAPWRSKPVTPTETVGVSGTPIFGGYISSPEKNPLLTGTRRYETYSEFVANTAIVGAAVRLFLNMLAKPDWKVIPANESPEAQAIADRVDAIIHGMTQPWCNIIRTAGRFRFYGFSIQEITAKRLDDGTIGLLDIEARPQYTIEQWDADSSGTVAGVIQRDPATGQPIYLPRSKVLYLVDNSLTDSPDGLGLLRHVAESVRHLVRLEQLEGYGFESDLGGVPVGRAPLLQLAQAVTKGNITQVQADAMVKGMTDFVSNRIKNPSQGMILDSTNYTDLSESATPSGVQQWGMDILTGEGGRGLDALSTSIERLNREIARVLGVEHLMLGGDGAGSLALSRDKTSQFAALLEGTLNEIAWSVEHDVLERLRQWNGWPAELMPTLMPESLQMRDVEDVAATLAQMAQAGAPLGPNDPAINEVRAQLKLSPIPDSAMAGGALLPAQPTYLTSPPPPAPMPGDAQAPDTGQVSDAQAIGAGPSTSNIQQGA